MIYTNIVQIFHLYKIYLILICTDHIEILLFIIIKIPNMKNIKIMFFMSEQPYEIFFHPWSYITAVLFETASTRSFIFY